MLLFLNEIKGFKRDSPAYVDRSQQSYKTITEQRYTQSLQSADTLIPVQRYLRNISVTIMQTLLKINCTGAHKHDKTRGI